MFFLLDIEDGSGNEDDKKTWYDFVVEKEQLFIRNIYSKEEHADMENISHIADYHREFGRFVKIVMLLKNISIIRGRGRTVFWKNFSSMI